MGELTPAGRCMHPAGHETNSNIQHNTPEVGLQSLRPGDCLAPRLGVILNELAFGEGTAGCPQHAQLLLTALVQDMAQKLQDTPANLYECYIREFHGKDEDWCLIPCVISKYIHFRGSVLRPEYPQAVQNCDNMPLKMVKLAPSSSEGAVFMRYLLPPLGNGAHARAEL